MRVPLGQISVYGYVIVSHLRNTVDMWLEIQADVRILVRRSSVLVLSSGIRRHTRLFLL